MNHEALRDDVERRLATLEGEEGAISVEVAHDECTVRAEPGYLHPVLASLRDSGFDMLVFVTAVDRAESMEVVYRLGSTKRPEQLFVKARLDRAAPEAPTATDLWPAAGWHERETADLFGLTFAGHPDPRALILPEDWVGYPLRKDYEDPSMERRPDYM